MCFFILQCTNELRNFVSLLRITQFNAIFFFFLLFFHQYFVEEMEKLCKLKLLNEKELKERSRTYPIGLFHIFYYFICHSITQCLHSIYYFISWRICYV